MEITPTPLEEYSELAAELGLQRLFIKREDMNPSGSHKDRAIWSMLDHYYGSGEREFVISSSGNAAVSASYYLKNNKIANDIKLNVFVSPKMPDDKKQRLNELLTDTIVIHESSRAKSDAIKFAKENNFQLLRTSTDNLALDGYGILAGEISEQLSHINSANVDIFIPTSSGTTLQGMYQGLKAHLPIRANKKMMYHLHMVQTTKIHPIAKEFDREFEPSDSSHSFAITDTIAHRKGEVEHAVKSSGGSGWVVSDQELESARTLLEEKTDVKNASWDSLLSLAGLQKALKQGSSIENAVLMFTGK